MVIDDAHEDATVTSPGLPAAQIGDLCARLERSRRRLQVRRYIHACSFALWLGASVAVAVSISAWAAGMDGVLLLPVIVGGVVAAAAAAIGALRVHLSPPDLANLARRAETLEGLHESLSTAIEAAQRTELHASPVAQSLFRQVSMSADRVDPHRLVERRPLHEAVAMFVPILLIAMSLAVPSTWGRSSDVAQADIPLEPERTRLRDASSTDLRRSAELVHARADERDDAYLHAVARALEELEKLVASEAATPEQARAEVDRLLDEVARAYGLTRRSPPSEADDRRAATSLAERNSDGAGTSPTDTPPTDDQAGIPPLPAATGEALAKDDSSRMAFADLLDELGTSTKATRESLPTSSADPNAPSPLEGLSRADITGYDSDEDWERYLRQMQFLERLGPQAGQAIGAAQQSSRGDSDRGGEGSQELFDEDEAGVARDRAQNLVDITLPDTVRSSGRRITLELPPEARRSAVAEADAIDIGPWWRGDEVTVDRPNIAGRHLEVLSRYFVPFDAPSGPNER